MYQVFNEVFTNGFSYNVIYLISFVSILCGIFVITSKNPIVSVLFLIGLFISIALYLFMLGTNFIGLSYLLVYVGAVSILFLFILMLINVRISELSSNSYNSIALGVFVGVLFSTAIFELLPSNFSGISIIQRPVTTEDMLIGFLHKLYHSGTWQVTSQAWDGSLAVTSHITSIGNIIYTAYPVLLILTSLILLLAMVGVIVITINPSPDSSNGLVRMKKSNNVATVAACASTPIVDLIIIAFGVCASIPIVDLMLIAFSGVTFTIAFLLRSSIWRALKTKLSSRRFWLSMFITVIYGFAIRYFIEEYLDLIILQDVRNISWQDVSYLSLMFVFRHVVDSILGGFLHELGPGSYSSKGLFMNPSNASGSSSHQGIGNTQNSNPAGGNSTQGGNSGGESTTTLPPMGNSGSQGNNSNLPGPRELFPDIEFPNRPGEADRPRPPRTTPSAFWPIFIADPLGQLNVYNPNNCRPLITNIGLALAHQDSLGRHYLSGSMFTPQVQGYMLERIRQNNPDIYNNIMRRYGYRPNWQAQRINSALKELFE